MKKYIQSLGRTGLFAGLALLLGVLGVIASRLNQPTVVPPPPKLFDVPVATTDLQAGRLIAKSDFYVKKLTLDQMKAAGFKEAYFSVGKDLIDRIVRTPIRKNQYFTMDSLYPEGTGPSISEKLRPGMRAVMIPVDAASITNLTTPDSFVDVLFRPTVTPQSDGRFTLAGGRILERAEVLAVNQKWYAQTLPALQQDSHVGAGVTLSVSPEQAEMLKSLEPLGRFSLIAAPDAGPAPSGEVPDAERMKRILGLNDPLPEPVVVPMIELVRGGVISRVPLDSPIAASTPWDWDSYLVPSAGDIPMDPSSVPANQEPPDYPDPIHGPTMSQPDPQPTTSPVPLPDPQRAPSGTPSTPVPPSPTLLDKPIPPQPQSSRRFDGRVRVSKTPSAGPVASKSGSATPRKFFTKSSNQPQQIASTRAVAPAASRLATVSITAVPSVSSTSRTTTSAVASQPAANVPTIRHASGANASHTLASAPSSGAAVNPQTRNAPLTRSGSKSQVSASWMRPAAGQRVLRASNAFKSVTRR